MKNLKKLLAAATLFLAGTVAVQADELTRPIDNLQGGTNKLEGYTYYLTRTLEYNMNNTGQFGPALRVKEGVTATLIIPKGLTFTLWGSNAQGSSPAYPAIELPKTSTLIIKGEGKLIVNGGDGLHRGRGGNGGDARMISTPWYVPFNDEETGRGGAGGAGSYGNAPGIGTPGGIGGKGGASPTSTIRMSKGSANKNRAEESQYKGGDGSNGGSSAGMGKLIILGQVSVTSVIGANAYPSNHPRKDTDQATAGKFDTFNSWNQHAFAGGGGGGNGGTCASVDFGIGAGAPGGGGGGGGGTGGTDEEWSKSNLDYFFGYGGIGGKGNLCDGYTGQRGFERRVHGSGGKAGDCGQAGSKGDNGQVVYAPSTALEVMPSKKTPKDIDFSALKPVDPAKSVNLGNITYKEMATTYKAAMNHMNGATVTGIGAPAFYQGMQLTGFMPNVEPQKSSSATTYFKGYSDQYGNQVFNANGELDIVLEKYAPESKDGKNTNIYTYARTTNRWYINAMTDITLHPIWQDSVTVVVRHIIEDADCTDAQHKTCFDTQNHNVQVITEAKRFGLKTTSPEKVRSEAFKTLDGKSIEELAFRDGRFYVLDGEEAVQECYMDKEQVILTHHYLRKAYTLTWDFSAGAFTDDEINASLLNADSYTHGGQVKQGKQLCYPALKPIRGKIIDGWTPANTEAMTAGNLTLKAEVKDALFTVRDDVQRGSTECSLKLTPATATYNQQVTLSLKLEKGCYLTDAQVLTVSDQTPVTLTQVNDTTYTFLMPNDHVRLTGEFVLARTKAISISSNQTGTHVALYDPTDGKYYTDEPDIFGLTATDTQYGGALKDFEVYKSKRIDVLTTLDATDANKALRPTVSVSSQDSETEYRMDYSLRKINGRDRKVFSYWAEDGSPLTFNIRWNRQTEKEIALTLPISTKVTSMQSDVNDDIMTTISSGKKGGKAYANDFITFTVNTKASFGRENIFAFYLDAHGVQIPILVDVEKDTVTAGNYVCSYTMPDRDMTIHIETGKKVAVNLDLPYEYDNCYIPDSAVVGSTIPFIILMHHNNANDVPMIKHPIGLYKNGQKFTENTPFQHAEIDNTNTELAFCSFVVPDDETFVIKNGISFHPQLEGTWFTFYCDEKVTLPEYVEIHNIAFDAEDNLVLKAIEGQDVMPGQPVICKIQPFGSGGDKELNVFVASTPTTYDFKKDTHGKNIVAHGTLIDACCDTLMQSCQPDEKIYRLAYDIEKASPCFVEADESIVIHAFSFYLKGKLKTTPVYPTGLSTVTADEATVTAPAYNLYGMPVDAAQQGFLIKEGKKLNVKN